MPIVLLKLFLLTLQLASVPNCALKDITTVLYTLYSPTMAQRYVDATIEDVSMLNMGECYITFCCVFIACCDDTLLLHVIPWDRIG